MCVPNFILILLEQSIRQERDAALRAYAICKCNVAVKWYILPYYTSASAMEQVDLSILVIATEVYLQTRVASNIGFYVFFFRTIDSIREILQIQV